MEDDADDGTGTGDDEKNGMIVIAVVFFLIFYSLELGYYCATDTARQIIRAENGFHFQTSKSDVLLLL